MELIAAQRPAGQGAQQDVRRHPDATAGAATNAVFAFVGWCNRLRCTGLLRARRALASGAGRQSLGGRGGEGELLAGWLADAVLARRMNWPFALPLLAASLCPGAGRRASGLENRADRGETTRVLIAFAKAAAGAVDRTASSMASPCTALVEWLMVRKLPGTSAAISRPTISCASSVSAM